MPLAGIKNTIILLIFEKYIIVVIKTKYTNIDMHEGIINKNRTGISSKMKLIIMFSKDLKLHSGIMPESATESKKGVTVAKFMAIGPMVSHRRPLPGAL